MSFLHAQALDGAGPQRFVRLIERVLWHLGFVDVRIVDGRDDGGGDILAVRSDRQWVIQCKWSGRRVPIDRTGIDDCERAKTRYGADHTVLATNATLGSEARRRRKVLAEVGIHIDVWDRATLAKLFEMMPGNVSARPHLRAYQLEAVAALEQDLEFRERALLILATGLGKTVIAAELVRRHLEKEADSTVLVVAHLRELVDQLERAFWKHLEKHTETQVLAGASRPKSMTGVTFATVNSALSAVGPNYQPSLVVVDETHHVGQEGMYQVLLDACARAKLLGVTATPWRGDKFDITSRFGPASFRMSIEDGMRAGYLARVDYRVMSDNLDWDFVRSCSEFSYSIAELNSRLFLPQRDAEILDTLRRSWKETVSPRALVFCQSIDHAERMARLLAKSDPAWSRAAALHSGLSKQRREQLLNAFRLGRSPLLTSVDVFNEGVDVPDVNLIAFLRVTHSRRIFVQQLGRGLRLREGKDKLIVLDFVSDIRRVAAVLNLKRSIGNRATAEELTLPLSESSTIAFSDMTVGHIMDAWIRDAADLETAAEEVRLQFPDVSGVMF